MSIMRKVISVLTALLLSVSFVGAGLAACLAPPVTGVFANVFSDDATSPFSRSQLVQVASATRDYTFGDHGKTALYRAIYDVDKQYRDQLEAGGGRVPSDFPKLDEVVDTGDADQLAAAFEHASEMYCFSPETVGHLDDCHALASAATPLLAVAAALAVAGLVFTGVACRKRTLGAVLIASGAIVIVAFAALAAWAIIDFAGLFAAFHGLFFSAGSWIFPYDSLLICALPQAFWAAMAALWLAVAVVLSILSIVIGKKLRK